jgi:hypothetical protein
MTLRGGDRRSKSHRERLKLDDLGISRNQSTRWQMQARVPENVFREHIKQTCDSGKELTSARLIRLAKRWDKSVTVNGSANGNGHGARRNGKLGLATSRSGSDRLPDDPVAEIVSELINHHQLLDNVLRPIYTGESTSLVAAERRVLRYLLLEVQQLLARLDKWQRRDSRCQCRDERPAW